MYGIITLYDRKFHCVPFRLLCLYRSPTTPYVPKHTGFGLFPGRSPLPGESLICFLFLRVMRCFSSPRSPPLRDDILRIPGCPIRKSPGRGLFAPRRSLSQLITSFFAYESQGIHHTPLFACHNISFMNISLRCIDIYRLIEYILIATLYKCLKFT